MKPFIENSLKEFVKKRKEIFGFLSEFVSFESCPIAESRFEGRQSDTIFGCIRYRNENGDILLSSPLVLKCPPPMSPVAEALLFQFINEIFVYGHILPYFAHLDPSVLQLFPKFYGSFTQTYPESCDAIILLENLEYSSYQNAPCKSFLDYDHLSLMVRSLGKFHASSYLAKMLDPLSFNAHALSLNPISSPIIGKFKDRFTIFGTRGLKHLESEYKSSVPVIQHLLEEADLSVMSIFKNEGNNPWAVVCHGDYLAGNVMFKYHQSKPVHMKMIDLATSTFSSPVLDLALVLYINANQETRDLYWDQLIDDYIDGLSSLSVPTANLPSKDVIMREFQSKAFYAYLMASFFLPVLVSEDLNLGPFSQLFPPEYIHCKHYLELPEDVQMEVTLKIGGEIGTQHLVDILKDMLKRGFIRNSSLSNGRCKDI